MANKKITEASSVSSLSTGDSFFVNASSALKQITKENVRQNINFIGNNPITSTEADTPSNWASLGTGYARFSNYYLTDQSSKYGMLINMTNGDDVKQVFFTLPSGDIISRAGQSSDWKSTWVKILDENNGIQIVKLWENASPTSSFAAQKVSLDLSSYDMVLVTCANSNTSTGVNYQSTTIGLKGIKCTHSTQVYYFRGRDYTVADDGITFAAAVHGNASWTTSTDNTVVIPVKIYGIKGVQ